MEESPPSHPALCQVWGKVRSCTARKVEEKRATQPQTDSVAEAAAARTASQGDGEPLVPAHAEVEKGDEEAIDVVLALWATAAGRQEPPQAPAAHFAVTASRRRVVGGPGEGGLGLLGRLASGRSAWPRRFGAPHRGLRGSSPPASMRRRGRPSPLAAASAR